MNNKGYGVLEIILGVVICFSIASVIVSFIVTADDVSEEFERVRCTCYLPTGNKTADGTVPYEGIIASNREHLGDTAILYTEDMVFIGYYECRDTGGHKALKNGTRIDMFCESKESMRNFISTYGDYVLIKWIKAEG